MKKYILFIASVAISCLSSSLLANELSQADLLNTANEKMQIAHSAWGRHTWCERNPRQCARERAWCARHPRECHGHRLEVHHKHHHRRHHR